MVVTATMADMNAMVIGTEIGIGIVMSPAVMTENAIGIVMEVGVDAKSMMNIPADDMMMNEDGSADLVTRSTGEEAEVEAEVEVEDTVDVEEGAEVEAVVENYREKRGEVVVVSLRSEQEGVLKALRETRTRSSFALTFIQISIIREE